MAKKGQSIEAWIREHIAGARQHPYRILRFYDSPPQIDEPAAKAAFALVAAEFPECVGLDANQKWFDDRWLSALAAQAQHLPELQLLEFCYTQVSDAGLQALADQARHLTQLQWLEFAITQVSDTGLGALAAQARHLPQLQSLNFNGSQVSDAGLGALAAQAQHLPQLQSLHFSGTLVSDAGLQVLGQAWQAGHLPQLSHLSLIETKVRSVSFELLFTRDARHILDAAVKGVAVAEAKLVVLGEPDAGKSWLCERFFLGQIPQERKETHDFELMQPAWRPRVGNLPVGLRVWDFGGQHILHGTHEMFLTHRSVCLVVVDVTRDLERNRLSYWLNMVRHFVGSDAKVILIVTQCDRPPNEQQLGALDAEGLQHASRLTSPLHLVEGFSAIGTEKSHQQAIENLRKAIEDALGKMELHARVQPNLPKIEARVEREMKDRALASLEEYRRWCNEEGIDQRDQDGLLRTLHNFGRVFFWGKLPSEKDRDKYGVPDDLPPGQQRLREAEPDPMLERWLINPRWLKWPVYKVVRLLDARTEPTPWVNHEQIEQAVKWITKDLKLPLHPDGVAVTCAVLKLTQQCIYQESERAYFFPRGLLNDPQTHLALLDWERPLQVVWEWGFFPEAAIHRFLVRGYAHGQVIDCWRTGAVLQDSGARAAVISQPEEGRVTVLIKRSTDQVREPSTNESKLVNHVILPRLVDLIGREPTETRLSWVTPSQDAGLGRRLEEISSPEANLRLRKYLKDNRKMTIAEVVKRFKSEGYQISQGRVSKDLPAWELNMILRKASTAPGVRPERQLTANTLAVLGVEDNAAGRLDIDQGELWERLLTAAREEDRAKLMSMTESQKESLIDELQERLRMEWNDSTP